MSVDLTKIDPSRISTAPKGKAVDLSTVHPDRISTEPPQEPGFVEHALERLDAYTGAPVRAAVDTMKGDPTDFILGLLPGVRAKDKAPVVEAAKAYKNQLGADAKTAPTPQHLLYQDKVTGPPITKTVDNPKFREAFAKSFTDLSPTDPGYLPMKALTLALGEEETKGLLGKVPKGVAVFGAGAATDPMSYIPATELAKPITKVGGAITKRAAGLLPETASSGIRNTVSRAASQFTGVPKEIWNNYIKRSKEVGELANTYQGEEKFFDAYKDFRQAMAGTLEGRKGQLSELIDQGLTNASKKPSVQSQPLLDSLNEAKKGLDPDTEAGAIKEIDGLISMVRKKAPEGKMTPKDAYKLQRWFHDRARGSYQEAGNIFTPSKQSAKAAKGVRYQLTEQVNKYFPDTIGKANKEYVELHNIDDILTQSMLDPEGTRTALVKAGLDPNSREAHALGRLSEFLHGDDRLLQQAKDLATFQKVGEMGWTPWSGGLSTSTSRSLLGAGIGLGSQTSDDPTIRRLGALTGGMMTSPAAWKMGLDAGLVGKGKIAAVAGKGGFLDKRAEQIRPFIQALERRLNPALEKGINAAEDFIKDEAGAFTPDELLKMLKGDKTYDLTKAREMAGPPKGLLPGEGGNPAGAFKGTSELDGEVYARLKEKMNTLKPLTDQERQFLKTLQKNATKAKDTELSKEISNEWTRYQAREWAKNNERVTKAYEAKKATEQPRGLLTNLNVERGPVKELPEAGRQIGEIRRTTEGVRGIRNPSNSEIEQMLGEAEHSWMDKIQEVISNGYQPTKEEGRRLFKLSQNFDNPKLSERAQNILDDWERAIEKNEFKPETTRESREAARKAAEAKKVVSVDVPGAPKRGRAPDIKPEMAYKPRALPADAKFKIGEEVMHEGRPVKIVQYDGKGVYTIKKGNTHDQVHMSDLKPKGKPTKPKGKK